jgi:metallo-beta-lactamase family protein
VQYPSIVHHGAVTGVTGSCHQLQMDDEHALLIDCGLFQGAETSPEGRAGAGKLAIDFSLDGVKALVATHVHIDHVGRIPYLLAAGFNGPILCSEPSAKLLPIVLEDAFKLGFSRDQKQVERYLKLIEQRIVALPYKQWFTLIDTKQLNARIRLQRAGHILGSAYVEVDLHYPETGEKKRIVFSGDLGAPHAPILPAPKAPYKADILVIESTYGDRLHEDRRSRRARLEKVLEHALSNQGTVMIPAFSIGRTQELLYELEDIIHRRALKESGKVQSGTSETISSKAKALDWTNLPIILDSPLASRFTAVYRELDQFWDAEARAPWPKVVTRWPSVTCSRSTATRPIWPWSIAWPKPLSQPLSSRVTACAPAGVSSTTSKPCWVMSGMMCSLSATRLKVRPGDRFTALVRVMAMWNLTGSAMTFGLRCIP